MITVYKYPIEINDTVNLDIQGFIRCLKIASQNNQLCLWALVDTERKTYDSISFEIRGTGHDCENLKGSYMDTVFQSPFVWHIFVKEPYRWQWLKSS